MSTTQNPSTTPDNGPDVNTLPPRPATASLTRSAGAVLVAGGVTVLASLLINPGPGLNHVDDSTFATGHLANGAGYLLLVLGMPALAASLGRSLGVAGIIGYGALGIRYVLSTGSQLFQATLYPTLAARPELRAQMISGGRLSTIYGSWSDEVTLILAIGLLGLVVSLWRAGRTLRLPAALIFVAAVANPVLTPVTVVLASVALGWLGLRIAVRGDLRAPLRNPNAH